jgi:hypothetical protein
MKIGKMERKALEHADWAERQMGWNICGSRTYRRATLKGLEAKGLLISVGPVTMCDGDGFALEPERFRFGYALTNKGKYVLSRLAEPVEKLAG